jgi:hypothetical protein
VRNTSRKFTSFRFLVAKHTIDCSERANVAIGCCFQNLTELPVPNEYLRPADNQPAVGKVMFRSPKAIPAVL